MPQQPKLNATTGSTTYRAVCPCPLCSSRHTILQLPDAQGTCRWRCSACGHLFTPPDEPCGRPVLACSSCGTREEHVFAELGIRRWVGGAANGGDLCRSVVVEVYACLRCGTTRDYGFGQSSSSTMRQPEAA